MLAATKLNFSEFKRGHSCLFKAAHVFLGVFVCEVDNLSSDIFCIRAESESSEKEFRKKGTRNEILAKVIYGEHHET